MALLIKNTTCLLTLQIFLECMLDRLPPNTVKSCMKNKYPERTQLNDQLSSVPPVYVEIPLWINFHVLYNFACMCEIKATKSGPFLCMLRVCVCYIISGNKASNPLICTLYPVFSNNLISIYHKGG